MTIGFDIAEDVIFKTIDTISLLCINSRENIDLLVDKLRDNSLLYSGFYIYDTGRCLISIDDSLFERVMNIDELDYDSLSRRINNYIMGSGYVMV